MMRTTNRVPDLGETITFPADSMQHQMTILTLVTHMLLSIPVIHNRTLSWKIVQHPTSHHQTVHIKLATLALKRCQTTQRFIHTSTYTIYNNNPDPPYHPTIRCPILNYHYLRSSTTEYQLDITPRCCTDKDRSYPRDRLNNTRLYPLTKFTEK